MKIIPFYLPQFHEIPENNEFWGEGFTEWTNVKNAKPQFEGHKQPNYPYNNNFYNLLDIDVMKWQAKLAKEYGVYGMCIYHYWIEGRKLLEKPLENLLANKDVDMKYCISWANHSWTDSWVGTRKTLIAQTYGGKEDWDNHFDYLLDFFKDERYIKANDKPLLLIFNPEDIPNLNEMLDYWQKRAKESGLKGISFAYQNYYYGMKKNCDESRFDFGVEHQPAYAFADYRAGWVRYVREYGYKFLSFIQTKFHFKINMNKMTRLERMDYSKLWQCILERKPKNDKRIPGAFTNWDNTPRKGSNGLVVEGGSPELFEKFMTEQIKRAKDVYHKDMLFVAAWNEWAEGSMLEPDTNDGYGYLEALKKALINNGEFPNE